MMKALQYHWELDVYKLSVEVAMEIFRLTKRFPSEERYSLTDQVRRSSRSVSAQLAEAWRKRKYEAAFLAKLNDAEAEAAETQVWIEYAVKCEYLNRVAAQSLHKQCDHIIGKLVNMANHPEPWLLKKRRD
jgi:four helix bundle protein